MDAKCKNSLASSVSYLMRGEPSIGMVTSQERRGAHEGINPHRVEFRRRRPPL